MPVHLVSIKKPQEVKGLKPAVKVGKIKTETEQAVDSMAELDAKISPVKQAIKEYEALRRFLQSRVPDTAEKNAPFTFEGTSHDVEFSACRKEKTVADLDKLKKYLGVALFNQLIKINVSDLEAYLTPEQFKDVVGESQTGSRSHKLKVKVGEAA